MKVGSGYEKQPIYFTNTSSPAADAVITEVKGNQVKLWLGGVNPAAMKAVRQGTGEHPNCAKVRVEGAEKLPKFDRRELFGSHYNYKNGMLPGTVFTSVGVKGGNSGRVTLQSRDASNGLIGIATVEEPGVYLADNTTVRLDADNEPQPEMMSAL